MQVDQYVRIIAKMIRSSPVVETGVSTVEIKSVAIRRNTNSVGRFLGQL